MGHGSSYRGRFAPSPTGLLHAGSLVAALASWLDARAHSGQWQVRMEDVDTPRCIPGAGEQILQQLATCGLHPDGPVLWQSQRQAAYQQALDTLVQRDLAYPCACTRKDIAQALAAQGLARDRHAELRYPGTCRQGVGTSTASTANAAHPPLRPPRPQRPERAWRLRTQQDSSKNWPPALYLLDEFAPEFDANTLTCHWHDRQAGWQQQDVDATVGDFVLKRADGLWAYQLAVVVDDAAQGITHVVRGADLLDNTPRQLLLQRALGLPHPVYLHTPLVLGANGEKLSKQNGAAPLVLDNPAAVLAALNAAAIALGLPLHPGPVAEALGVWVTAWPHAAP
ncbi:glutamyl-Q tRNA(Asp) synthetase [Hydrogenophaga soli]